MKASESFQSDNGVLNVITRDDGVRFIVNKENWKIIIGHFSWKKIDELLMKGKVKNSHTERVDYANIVLETEMNFTDRNVMFHCTSGIETFQFQQTEWEHLMDYLNN
ncbi:hypothetical protein CVD28_02405 [Bacillus sp. M6-12]|uniref:hypothetical protein n=1 Tax=Bacillus sp. M6-12 TaxID=2054166 RepID=UPI000C75ADBB|nr:hypothetical protein [Bacillus sp. M6-12]PLS19284.1 hypothetical protein CVD28_02405 [Bacillus sp. M6-12]